MSNNCTPIYNLCIAKGETWRQDFLRRIHDVAVDLTGYTARLQFTDSADGAVIADLTTANGKLTITALEGRISAVLTHTETRAITQDSAEYALLLKDAAGDRIKHIRGTVDFEPPQVEDVDA